MLITAMITDEFWQKLVPKWVDVCEGELEVVGDLSQDQNDVRTGKGEISVHQTSASRSI